MLPLEFERREMERGKERGNIEATHQQRLIANS
jgi:hypothetical protein